MGTVMGEVEYHTIGYTRNVRRPSHRRQISFDIHSIYSESYEYAPLQNGETSDIDESTGCGLVTRKVVSVNHYEWRRLTGETGSKRQLIQPGVLHPNSVGVIFWSLIILILDATYTAFYLPIYVSFDCHSNNWDWITVIDLVTGLLFTIDFFLSFFVGYVAIYNGEKTLVQNRSHIFRLYRNKGGFYVDLITVLASWGQIVLGIIFAIPDMVVPMKIVRVLRMVRILWVIKVSFKLALSVEQPNQMQVLNGTSFHMFCVFYCMAILMNALACLFYKVAWVAPGGIQNSWLEERGYLNAPAPQRYIASLYYVVTTVSTVGYGDISPRNWVEELAAVFMIAVGVVFFAFLIGTVQELLHSYSRKMRSGQMYKDKIAAVNNWMSSRKFSNGLQNDIRGFYTMMVNFTENPDTLYTEELPMELKSRVIREQINQCVNMIPIIRDAPEEFLEQLCPRMQAYAVPVGGDLCQEGDAADSVWILVEGQLKVYRYGICMQDINAPCLVVDSALVHNSLPNLGSKRLCTLTCKTNCRVMEIQANDINYLTSLTLFNSLRSLFLEELRKFTDQCLSYVRTSDTQLDAVLKYVDSQLMADSDKISQIFSNKQDSQELHLEKISCGNNTKSLEQSLYEELQRSSKNLARISGGNKSLSPQSSFNSTHMRALLRSQDNSGRYQSPMNTARSPFFETLNNVNGNVTSNSNNNSNNGSNFQSMSLPHSRNQSYLSLLGQQQQGTSSNLPLTRDLSHLNLFNQNQQD